MNLFKIHILLGIIFSYYISWAGTFIKIQGSILRVENSIVFLKTKSGERKIALKDLTKKDTELVKKETGSKREVTLRIPMEFFTSGQDEKK